MIKICMVAAPIAYCGPNKRVRNIFAKASTIRAGGMIITNEYFSSITNPFSRYFFFFLALNDQVLKQGQHIDLPKNMSIITVGTTTLYMPTSSKLLKYVSTRVSV